MRLRTIHGASKKSGALVDLENEPLDEKPHAPAGVADLISAGRDDKKRVRTTEAARALAKLPRKKAFRPRDIEVAPAFTYFYRQRLEWLKQRSRTLTHATGACSEGVMMRLRKSAWIWAWSEYADELAAKTADIERAEQAARLAEKADKLDWSAWTLACREGEVLRESGRGENDIERFRRELAEDPLPATKEPTE